MIDSYYKKNPSKQKFGLLARRRPDEYAAQSKYYYDKSLTDKIHRHLSYVCATYDRMAIS